MSLIYHIRSTKSPKVNKTHVSPSVLPATRQDRISRFIHHDPQFQNNKPMKLKNNYRNQVIKLATSHFNLHFSPDGYCLPRTNDGKHRRVLF
jgi:hypothetical protein